MKMMNKNSLPGLPCVKNSNFMKILKLVLCYSLVQNFVQIRCRLEPCSKLCANQMQVRALFKTLCKSDAG